MKESFGWKILKMVCTLPIWWVFTETAILMIHYGLPLAKPFMRGNIGQALTLGGCWILASMISDKFWR